MELDELQKVVEAREVGEHAGAVAEDCFSATVDFGDLELARQVVMLAEAAEPSGRDDAELLRIHGAGLSARERGEAGGRGGDDADRGAAVRAAQDVREVLGRGGPGGHDRARRGEVQGSPGDVLADRVSGQGVGDVAAGPDAVQRGFAVGRDVVEVVLGDHLFAVASGRLCQRRLVVARAVLVDEAEGGRAGLFEVAGLGRQFRAAGRILSEMRGYCA